MVRVVLIRHGDKKRLEQKDEMFWPLTAEAENRTRELAETLSAVQLLPVAYITSEWEHARQTAEILAAKSSAGRSPRLAAVTALTPKTAEERFTITSLIDEAVTQGIALDQNDVFGLVGHEPRLSLLITQMTSRRIRPLDRLEAVVVQAGTLTDLLRGRGTIECRIPVRDSQEEQLRPKIRSKMTVATFLAGFTFNALIGLLRDRDLPSASLAADSWESVLTLLPPVAIISLTAALALFIASVYMLDSLTMPEGFWIGQPRPSFRTAWPQSFRDNVKKHGPFYANMKRTWEYVFTPGVFFALIGFGAILVRTKLTFVIVPCLAIIACAFVYYSFARPKLGTD